MRFQPTSNQPTRQLRGSARAMQPSSAALCGSVSWKASEVFAPL